MGGAIGLAALGPISMVAFAVGGALACQAPKDTKVGDTARTVGRATAGGINTLAKVDDVGGLFSV